MSSADYMVWFLLTAALAGLTTFGSLTAAYFVGKREHRRPGTAAPGQEVAADAQQGTDRNPSRTAA